MRRALAVLILAAAGCATPRVSHDSLEVRITEQLERRGLGREALLVPANLLSHGPPAPPAVPPVVPRLLGEPLAALDAERIFHEVVPSMEGLDEKPQAAFGTLLKVYLDELAEAQRLLRAATREFPEPDFSQGLPPSGQLLAVAAAVDAEGLRRANLAFIAATLRFAKGVRGAHSLPAEPQQFQTLIGAVVIGTRGNDRHGPGAAIVIDPGGDDSYERAALRGGGISVIVDLGGNDRYAGDDLALRGLSAIVDLSGNDVYEVNAGAALAGASLVIDFAGDDSYTARTFGLGAGALGTGVLVDLGGNDSYALQAWGQGFGIAGGVGVLWDRGGNDRYSASGVADPFGRGSLISGAQGAAFGARGRLGGGVGILRDDGGSDVYQAQMFAQGVGYYYGLGLLWDRDGNDAYEAHRYAQGQASHQAVGVLRDEGGDDRYSTLHAYGQGMGLDMALGVLVDAGGNDVYLAQAASQATATANGIGVLADGAGIDRFELADGGRGWGDAQWLRGLPSVGVLLAGESARFARAGNDVPAPPENPRVSVQPSGPTACPSGDPGEALLCRVLGSTQIETTWMELRTILEKEPATPLAGWIAIALARRPPAEPAPIAALLAQRESCNVRALALRAHPTAGAAEAGIRSPCYRLQAAARAALVGLGRPVPRGLPSFLEAVPPQDDTY
jgi:hypothetical protein